MFLAPPVVRTSNFTLCPNYLALYTNGFEAHVQIRLIFKFRTGRMCGRSTGGGPLCAGARLGGKTRRVVAYGLGGWGRIEGNGGRGEGQRRRRQEGGRGQTILLAFSAMHDASTVRCVVSPESEPEAPRLHMLQRPSRKSSGSRTPCTPHGYDKCKCSSPPPS